MLILLKLCYVCILFLITTESAADKIHDTGSEKYIPFSPADLYNNGIKMIAIMTIRLFVISAGIFLPIACI